MRTGLRRTLQKASLSTCRDGSADAVLVIDTRKGLPPSPSHRVLAAAKPYFRTAMIKRITVALDEGLEPGRVSRALSLVVEAREFDAECLLLKQALEQARIEQRVGGCADCGTQDRHSPRCPQFDFTWEDEEPADETPSTTGQQ